MMKYSSLPHLTPKFLRVISSIEVCIKPKLGVFTQQFEYLRKNQLTIITVIFPFLSSTPWHDHDRDISETSLGHYWYGNFSVMYRSRSCHSESDRNGRITVSEHTYLILNFSQMQVVLVLTWFWWWFKVRSFQKAQKLYCKRHKLEINTINTPNLSLISTYIDEITSKNYNRVSYKSRLYKI